MLGRPNLPRYNCESFRLHFKIKLPKTVADELLNGSIQYKDLEQRSVALYGKTYQVRFERRAGPRKSTVSVSETIFRVEPDVYEVSLIITHRDRGKPPKKLVTPDHLMNLLEENSTDKAVAINVEATYVFNRAEGWSTDGIGLPIPLDPPLRIVRGMPFNQIDGATFTHVEDDAIPERVQVDLTHRGQIVLDISLQRELIINRRTVSSLLRDGHRLSSGFVDKEEVL